MKGWLTAALLWILITATSCQSSWVEGMNGEAAIAAPMSVSAKEQPKEAFNDPFWEHQMALGSRLLGTETVWDVKVMDGIETVLEFAAIGPVRKENDAYAWLTPDGGTMSLYLASHQTLVLAERL